MTRRLVCVLLLAAGLAAWMAVAAPAADDALGIVPDDALAFGVVHNLSQIDGKIQKLGQKLHLPTPGVLEQAKTAFGIDKGLDEKGSAVMIVVPGEGSKDMPQVVVAVPVTNYGDFLDQLKPGNKEKISEVQLLQGNFLVAQRGNFALFAEASQRKALERVLEAKKSVASQLGGLEPWLAEQDAALAATPAGIKLFSVKAQEGLKQMQDMLSQLQQPASAAAAFDMYASMLKAAEKELALVALGVRSEKQTIYVDTRARFTPEGQAAKALSGIKPGEGNPLAGLPGGTFVFAGGGVLPESLWEPLMGVSVSMMKQNPKLYGLTPEQTEKLIQISRDSVKLMQGMAMEMKIGKRGEPIYGNIFGTVRTTDAGKYLADYEKQIQATNELLKDAKEGIMKPMQIQKTEIAGKPGLELEMTIPIPKTEVEIPNFDEMMEKLMGPGGKVKIYMAAADDRNVVFGLNTSKEAVARAIALAKDPTRGLAADADVAKTAALLPQGAQWVAYVSPRGVVAFGARVAAAFAPEEITARIPEFPKTPPVGIAVKASSGEAQLQVVVPEVIIETISSYVRQIAGQAAPEVP